MLLKQVDILQRNSFSDQKSIQALSKDLANLIKGQESSADIMLSTKQLLQKEDERDKVLFHTMETLYKNQNNIVKSFVERSNHIEGKVQEVLRLLTNLQASSAARRDKEQSLLKNLDASLIDKIELTLDDHEIRLRTSIIVSGLLMAFVTPVVIYISNKFIL